MVSRHYRAQENYPQGGCHGQDSPTWHQWFPGFSFPTADVITRSTTKVGRGGFHPEFVADIRSGYPGKREATHPGGDNPARVPSRRAPTQKERLRHHHRKINEQSSELSKPA